MEPEHESRTTEVADLVKRARRAVDVAQDFDQARVDDLCRAVAWATANESTFPRLARMSVEESGLGDAAGRVSKRARVLGVLRDVLPQPSVGLVEAIPELGIEKYAKPVGVVACIVPVTNPVITPITVALFALKCRNAVVFSPHPRSRLTANEVVGLMRAALEADGAPADLVQGITNPTIPLTLDLMAASDLVQATGGMDLVRAAYSSGTPAYGVGAGNATVIVDETADIRDAARDIRISKTADFGSGCSSDGNVLVESSVAQELVDALVAEGGYVLSDAETARLQEVLWDDAGRRTPDTIAVPVQTLAARAGIDVPGHRTFLITNQAEIGARNPFSREKLCLVLALYRFNGFDRALEGVARLLAVGGRGHSCAIHSNDDGRIRRLALAAPVSRIMVRQPQSQANAGWFTNGMPFTASLGCGTWGGNITSENIHLKHYMNTTWVSRTIPARIPEEQELFGRYYASPRV